MRSDDEQPKHVRLDIPPGGPGAGFIWLDGWGRTAAGQWWALVSWRDYLNDPVTHVGQHPQIFAAWAPAEHVHPSPGSRLNRYWDVPRVQLGADPAAWPGPPGWSRDDLHYLGVLDGREPAIPPQLGARWEGHGSAYG